VKVLEARIKNYKSRSKWTQYISLAQRVWRLATKGQWKQIAVRVRSKVRWNRYHQKSIRFDDLR
jgi:hypothetical protein